MKFENIPLDIEHPVENKITLNSEERASLISYPTERLDFIYSTSAIDNFSLNVHYSGGLISCYGESDDTSSMNAMLTCAATALIALPYGAAVLMSIYEGTNRLGNIRIA